MKHPVEPVYFAGAAIIENSNERDPDKWKVTVAPSRIVNRHGGWFMMLFVDGHASSMKASEVGFQYPKGYPLAMVGQGLNQVNRRFSCCDWPSAVI